MSPKDLMALNDIEFAEEYLNEVRDVFLFCCYTGLAYSDVKSLKAVHFTEIDGVDCILKQRDKSGQQSFVPLFPEAKVIVKRYEDHPICRIQGVILPVLSNQRMNNALKIIGNIAKLKEALHTHLARKTFASYAEDRGFNLDMTATMLGHSKSLMTERHYQKRRHEPVIKVFKQIMERADDGELNQQAG